MNKEAKYIFLIIAIFMFFLGPVSAQTTCSEDQRILRISGPTNAHGEVYSRTNYPIEICYDSLFGKAYVPDPGEDPHACTGENKVLGLSAATNAHAQSPASSGYNTNVCFGDLSCAARTSGSCQTGETEVLRLSGINNAHMEVAGRTNYDVALCCTTDGIIVPGEGEFVDVEWRDFQNNPVTSSFVNRTVKLHAETSGFANGVEIIFEIWEDDALQDDPIRTVSRGDELRGTINSQVASVDWTITDQDIANGGGEETSEFYFIAKEQSSGEESDQSPILSVENQNNNQPPTAVIAGDLKHRGIYFTGVDINFDHLGSDPNGPIVSFEWVIESPAGTIEHETNEESFTYQFDSIGEKTITLRVEDEQGLSHEEQIAVLAVRINPISPNQKILTFIGNPEHKQVLKNNLLEIEYDTSESYAINNQYSSCGEISCIAGNCPSETENQPAGSSCGGSVAVTGSGSFDADFLFEWDFNDGDTLSRTGDKLGALTGKKVYALPSNVFNDKKIDLILTHIPSGANEKTIRFFTLLESSQCLDGGRTYVQDPGTPNQAVFNTMNSNACMGPNGVIGGGDDCCPAGFSCTENGCRLEANSPEVCADYRNETACEDDDHNVAQNDPLWETLNCGEVIGGKAIQCACAWEDNEGECGLARKNVTSTGPTGPGCTEHQCLYTYDETTCQNGIMTITTRATFNAGTCPDPNGSAQRTCENSAGQYVVPCGQINFELGFFDKAQFIAALGSIFMIYFIFSLRKVNSNKKR